MQFRGGKKDERYLYILYINLSSSVGNFYRSCETRRDTYNNSFRRHFFQLFLISKFLPRCLSFTNNANLFSIGLKIPSRVLRKIRETNNSFETRRRVFLISSARNLAANKSDRNERLVENSMAVFRGRRCVEERRVNDRFVFHNGSKPREQWRTRATGILDSNGPFPTD